MAFVAPSFGIILELFFPTAWILETFSIIIKIKSFNRKASYYVSGIGIDVYVNALIHPKLLRRHR